MSAALSPLALAAFRRGWKPKSNLTVSEWSDTHRKLSKVGSAQTGEWRTSATPYLREIADQLSEHSGAQIVAFMKPTQIGGTELGVNWLGYIIHHAHGPVAAVMPTEKSMKDWTAQKFDPMAEGAAAVSGALAKRNNNSSDNNSSFKKFVGGIIYFKTAGSTAELKSTSLRYVLADEIDEWARETPQGDPFGLLQARQDNFHDRKTYVPSTPTMKDASRIEELYEGGDRRQYHVPCPHCGELQVLKWSNLKWNKKPNTCYVDQVWYVCAENGCVIDEWQKSSMLPELGHGGQARWIAQSPEAHYPSYHLNALYSPIGLGRGWRELAEQWIEAQDDPAKLQRFINTRLGETYRNASSDIKANVLVERAEPYALRTTPTGCMMITCGVDTQDNRLEIQVTGHGKGDRTWALDYHVLHGNPAGDELWQALADFVNSIKFQNACGKELISEACAIDTGGHFTHDVYAFVRSNRVRRAMACKGASTPGRSVLGKPSAQDVNWRGQSVKRGVMLYMIGADTGKHLLYNRLMADTDKPAAERKVHFSQQLESAYYDGLVAETFNPRKNRWEIKKGKRNEPLDTWVLSVAASHHPELYIHKWKASDWSRRAAMIEPEVVQPSAPEEGVQEVVAPIVVTPRSRPRVISKTRFA